LRSIESSCVEAPQIAEPRRDRSIVRTTNAQVKVFCSAQMIERANHGQADAPVISVAVLIANAAQHSILVSRPARRGAHMTVRNTAPAPKPLRLALLVDADADTRRMYAEYLRMSSSWSVEEAADGREGLAKAITRHPAVVVTETRLPGMSGFDLCHLLRSDPLTAHISIVVVTADALESDIARARAAGADSVLVKPCVPDRLDAELARVVDVSDEAKAATAAADQRDRDRVPGRPRPPDVLCPSCDTPLRHIRSHVGGVGKFRHEQWDYFECAAGCGTFQYRQRTRKLRKV